MRNAIVFLTYQPNTELIKFANRFNSPNLVPYICIDDSNYNTNNIKVKTIQYSYDECSSKGFIGLILPFTLQNTYRPCAWDKAMYHFCVKDTSFDNVYFVEDDVLIKSPLEIYNIEKTYPKADLICSSHISFKMDPFWPHWIICHDLHDKLLYHSMMCICRLSKKLLNNILNFAEKHGKLCYHECFFNVLAADNNYIIENPFEFKNITWNTNWNLIDFKLGLLYHPVKNVEIHKLIHGKYNF